MPQPLVVGPHDISHIQTMQHHACSTFKHEWCARRSSATGCTSTTGYTWCSPAWNGSGRRALHLSSVQVALPSAPARTWTTDPRRRSGPRGQRCGLERADSASTRRAYIMADSGGNHHLGSPWSFLTSSVEYGWLASSSRTLRTRCARQPAPFGKARLWSLNEGA